MHLIYPNGHRIIFLDASRHDMYDIALLWKQNHPDNKVHEANMGLTWVLSAPGGPHVAPMNLAIRVYVYLISLLLAEKGGDQCELILMMAFDKLKKPLINTDYSKWNILLSSDRCLQPLLVAINKLCWSHTYTMIYMVLLNYLYGITQLFI